MKFKNIHLYSAHIKKGGANMACDSLFTALSKSKSNIIFSRSSYKKEGEIKYNLNRVLGKVVASTTCQSQFYRPFISNNSISDTSYFSIVHAHWLNNVPLNSIPISKSLIITAHDQWLVNFGWAWDPITLNSPTRKIETAVNNISRSLYSSKEPLKYLADHYPLEKIITPSLWLKNYITEKTNFPGKKICVIKNIINTDIFKFDRDTYINFKKRNEKIVIVASTAYWQEWRKGRKLLMKIFRKIIHYYGNNVKFKIIGNIKIDTDIKQYSILYGNIKNKQHIARILNSSDCMVMPSRLENLTQTICEALLCGLPVVAFNVGGNKEIISDSSFGDLIDYPKVDRFISSITELKKSDDKIFRKQRAEKAKTKFSNESIIKKHLDLYEDYL